MWQTEGQNLGHEHSVIEVYWQIQEVRILSEDNHLPRILFEKNKPSGTGITTRIAPTSYEDIDRKDVPDSALSITMYSPYNEDDDYKHSRFVKLATCKKCPNQGVFEKEELDSLVNATKQYHCPFCINMNQALQKVKCS